MHQQLPKCYHVYILNYHIYHFYFNFTEEAVARQTLNHNDLCPCLGEQAT